MNELVINEGEAAVADDGLTPHKRAIKANADAMATERDRWVRRNNSYYRSDRRYMRFLVPEGMRVLDIGCGNGELLASLKPSYGVGLDLSERMVAEARKLHSGYQFVVGDGEQAETLAKLEGPFDYIVLSDTIGMFDDIENALKNLHALCSPETRVVIAYYSPAWEPMLRIGTWLGMRMPQPPNSLLSQTDFYNLLKLSDFDPVRLEKRQLIPFNLLGIGSLINRYLAPLPGIRSACLRTYVVARSMRAKNGALPSTSIVIPCRNERGNIERAIREMPRFGGHQEIIFVEGNSQDDTLGECERVKAKYVGEWDIKVLKQDGRGKGDAVRKGFDNAAGDILMILDADLTVPAATLPKFYDAIALGKGEFINGTRLVYPMQSEAMRFLNHIANRTFAAIFSYLLNQRFTDTLCGTKVLRKRDYEKIVASRAYFGDFDPFGDFDLIFGAAKRNLSIIEVPIQYKARTYGETQISRFRDGWLLLRMVVFAFKKLKAI